MAKFAIVQRAHQIDWRRHNISSSEKGFQNKRDYEHIVPRNLWEETLWNGIKKELPVYLNENGVQPHTGTHNLLSSWVVCANLYFPIRLNESLKKLMLKYLKQKVSDSIIEITKVELEFAFPKGDSLHPSKLLGELDGSRGSGQTSPDVAFIVRTKDGDGIVLTECKYTEHSFYKCSARRTEDNETRKGNPDPNRCMKVADNYENICHQTEWGRKYWGLLKLSDEGNKILKRCPAATSGYQLFRQQALAEGIMKSGRFSLVASAVAFDERNSDLKNCLRSTGVRDFQSDWASLFEAKALFKTWTHQEWVQFVRANQQNGEFDKWLNYLKARYDY